MNSFNNFLCAILYLVILLEQIYDTDDTLSDFITGSHFLNSAHLLETTGPYFHRRVFQIILKDYLTSYIISDYLVLNLVVR